MLRWDKSTKKNNLGGIPEEVLEPLAKDERDGNKMHQCADETTPSGIIKCEPGRWSTFDQVVVDVMILCATPHLLLVQIGVVKPLLENLVAHL